MRVQLLVAVTSVLSFAGFSACVNPFSADASTVNIAPSATSVARGGVIEFVVSNRSDFPVQWRNCDESLERKRPGSLVFEFVPAPSDQFCISETTEVLPRSATVIDRRMSQQLPPGDYRFSFVYAARLEPTTGPTGTAHSTVFRVE